MCKNDNYKKVIYYLVSCWSWWHMSVDISYVAGRQIQNIVKGFAVLKSILGKNKLL